MGGKGFTTEQGAVMSPRQRKFLDPRSSDFGVRFAIRLRDLLDKQQLTPAKFVDKLQSAGIDVTLQAVQKWLSAERIPRPQDMETIARLVGLKDYRFLLPPPI